MFHPTCINNWSKIKNNCPVCRRELTINLHHSIQKALRPYANNPDLETIIDIAINCRLDVKIFNKQLKVLGYNFFDTNIDENE
jgi:hypothetical protein